MKIIFKTLKWITLFLVLVIAGGAGFLAVSPPDLIRIGDGYTAKIVCSNVFVAGRDKNEVLADDVQAPGNPLLRLIFADVSDKDHVISAGFLGLFARQYAIFRPGIGCANVPDGDFKGVRPVTMTNHDQSTGSDSLEWPFGETVSGNRDQKVETIINDRDLHGEGMRAVVVVRDGRIIAETYGEGFDRKTALLGWSMTKTVTGALAAIRVKDGKLAWDNDHLLPQWSDAKRASIKLSDLMAMQSGLAFNEEYGDVTDVTRMLFLQPDQAGYAASLPAETSPGKIFNYSTGTAVLVSRIWMNGFASYDEALAFPRKALFDPLAMKSAIFETDSFGTFSGGSMLYATARDWARFGLLLEQGGKWKNQQLLPPDYIEMVRAPTPASGGAYSRAMAWKRGPGNKPDAKFGLPDDIVWMLGHDGQSIAIIPSQHLVVVRMGLTPGRLRYKPQLMVGRIIEATSGN